MKILVNTDNTIKGNHRLNNYIESHLEDSFERFAHVLTRVEVYLSDEHELKKCLLEARLSHVHPIVVTHYGRTIDSSLDGAIHKLLRSLNEITNKMSDHSVNDLNEEIEEKSHFSDFFA